VRQYRRRLVAQARFRSASSLVHLLSWASGGQGISTRVPFGPLHGMRLNMPTDDHPALSLGVYERHVVRAVREFTRHGDVAYDIGAHIGYVTLVFSRIAGTSGHVYSFEPDPRNVDMLHKNIANNRISNVSIVQMVVADVSRAVDFATFDYSFVNHIANGHTPGDATVLTLRSTTLDEYVYTQGNPAPDIIKIDVEGAELLVFRGAHRLLREARPVVIAEIRREYWDAIAQQVQQIGYRASVLGHGKLQQTGDLADVLLVPHDR